MPFLVEQWDKYYIRHSPRHPISLTKPPSEYFREQVFATFLDDEVGTHLLDTWGIDNFMWSNDYPHPNGTWPNSRAIIDRDLGHLTAKVRAKIVRGKRRSPLQRGGASARRIDPADREDVFGPGRRRERLRDRPPRTAETRASASASGRRGE